jgi:hypothetical protein
VTTSRTAAFDLLRLHELELPDTRWCVVQPCPGTFLVTPEWIADPAHIIRETVVPHLGDPVIVPQGCRFTRHGRTGTSFTVAYHDMPVTVAAVDPEPIPGQRFGWNGPDDTICWAAVADLNPQAFVEADT